MLTVPAQKARELDRGLYDRPKNAKERWKFRQTLDKRQGETMSHRISTETVKSRLNQQVTYHRRNWRGFRQPADCRNDGKYEL